MQEILQVLKKEKIVSSKTTWKEIPFYKPKPTKNCPDGYKGRIGVREVLEVSETIKEMVTKKITSDKIQAQAKKEGMLTMLEDGFIKAVQGVTSLEEILRITKE